MTESFLQYAWRYQLVEGAMTTTDGREVKVLRAGILNTDAGPDFFNARLLIGGVEWVGNVEVHVRASDWRQHHHSDDASYNNVVLHVVYEANEEVITGDGRTLPMLSLKGYIPEVLWNNYDALVHAPQSIDIGCADHLPSVSAMQLRSYMDRLVVERLERKTQDVQRLLDEAHGGWEHCCYWLVARYFGGKANALPFELLAKATDLHLLARWKDNPQRVEALLMGQAGLLEAYFEDDYPRQLQVDYQAIRAGSQLHPISAHLWKFFRLRPSSFPTLRISQLAQLVSQSSSLFSKLLDTTDASRLEQYFDVEASPYWTTHYQFDKPSKGRRKSLGVSMARSLVINAWVPLLFQYGAAHGDEALRERAVDILRQLPAEDNSIVARWRQAGIVAANAADSQALIQLYNEYCRDRRCLQCHIGYQVLKP
ncbi:MAG: DUF2851 family protein [Bacteroidales bacterium]|nr:DUF2851 family protein [Bacteroidales bacterium]